MRHNCGETAAALAAARVVSQSALDVRTLRSALIEAGRVIREDHML